ncbi:MAG: pseudouridine synthase [Novosphingobium sp.]|nr:pseudouridine synthase [Novosphingobium sp.]MDP3906825.1 pseudouridine synthase [Novosphingobium sp.]
MIEDRRIRLNDELVTTPATILTSLRGVTVDGKPVKAPEPTRLFLFHKPDGLITAERDLSGRPTIYTALRNALPPGTPRLMPVGRLDLNTEGLLLLTNDGEFKRQLELPSSGIPRKYRARTYGDITQNQLEDLIEGVTIDGMHYGKIDANMERRTGRNQWIEVTLTEGKNREVRRVLEHLGLEVSRLLRISYGPFELLDLPRGQAVEIRQVDLEKFRKSLKTGDRERSPNPHTTPAKPQSTWVKGGTVRDPAPAGRRVGRGLTQAQPYGERLARTDERPARGGARTARGDARPARSEERPARGSARPPRGDSRPVRSDEPPAWARPAGGDKRPARTDERPTRPENRTPRKETRSDWSDARPPRGDARPARPGGRSDGRPGGKPTGRPTRPGPRK